MYWEGGRGHLRGSQQASSGRTELGGKATVAERLVWMELQGQLLVSLLDLHSNSQLHQALMSQAVAMAAALHSASAGPLQVCVHSQALMTLTEATAYTASWQSVSERPQ